MKVFEHTNYIRQMLACIKHSTAWHARSFCNFCSRHRANTITARTKTEEKKEKQRMKLLVKGVSRNDDVSICRPEQSLMMRSFEECSLQPHRGKTNVALSCGRGEPVLVTQAVNLFSPNSHHRLEMMDRVKSQRLLFCCDFSAACCSNSTSRFKARAVFTWQMAET